MTFRRAFVNAGSFMAIGTCIWWYTRYSRFMQGNYQVDPQSVLDIIDVNSDPTVELVISVVVNFLLYGLVGGVILWFASQIVSSVRNRNQEEAPQSPLRRSWMGWLALAVFAVSLVASFSISSQLASAQSSLGSAIGSPAPSATQKSIPSSPTSVVHAGALSQSRWTTYAGNGYRFSYPSDWRVETPNDRAFSLLGSDMAMRVEFEEGEESKEILSSDDVPDSIWRASLSAFEDEIEQRIVRNGGSVVSMRRVPREQIAGQEVLGGLVIEATATTDADPSKREITWVVVPYHECIAETICSTMVTYFGEGENDESRMWSTVERVLNSLAKE